MDMHIDRGPSNFHVRVSPPTLDGVSTTMSNASGYCWCCYCVVHCMCSSLGEKTKRENEDDG